MFMRKLLFISAILLIVFFSCTKETTPAPSTPGCDVTGTYTGTAKDRFNTQFANTYKFFSNNYVSASAALTDPENAFGGYRNTCDSIIWNAHNNINNHKYLYKCVLSSNRTKLTGVYQDLDNPIDIGTLDLSKQ
jgi:hypothetical protein